MEELASDCYGTLYRNVGFQKEQEVHRTQVCWGLIGLGIATQQPSLIPSKQLEAKGQAGLSNLYSAEGQ